MPDALPAIQGYEAAMQKLNVHATITAEDGQKITLQLHNDSDEAYRWYENGADTETSGATVARALAAAKAAWFSYDITFVASEIGELIANGDLTMDDASAALQSPIIEDGDDALVLQPVRYYASDNGCVKLEIKAGSGAAAAQEYVESGEWGDSSETRWINVSAWLEGINAKGEIVQVWRESHRITLDPTEPDCEADEHAWDNPHAIVGGIRENPGVWGNGGGIVTTEVCMICGCARITDTWAQDPETGEQGLRSVKYEPGKFTDQVNELPESVIPDLEERGKEWGEQEIELHRDEHEGSLANAPEWSFGTCAGDIRGWLYQAGMQHINDAHVDAAETIIDRAAKAAWDAAREAQ